MTEIQRMASIADCAKETGLSYYYIRQLVLENKIRYVKSGKKTYVNVNSLNNYLNGKEESNRD